MEKDKGTIKIQSTQDIFLSAPELIKLESKQIVLKGEVIQATAEDKIELVAQNTIHAESADKMEIMGNTITEESEDKFTQQGKDVLIKANSKMNIDGGSKLDVKAGNIKMNQ